MPSTNSIQFPKAGFDNNKYLALQSEAIQERLEKFNSTRLYLEMGGKFINDATASRILPGYLPDNKIRLLHKLKDNLDIIFCINSNDIDNDRSLSLDGRNFRKYVLDLLEQYAKHNLPIPYIAINFFSNKSNTLQFEKLLRSKGYKTYRRFFIDGYPNDLDKVASANGYGKDEYIPVTKDIVLVVGPGSNSGKQSTALGQVYLENVRGIKSGYAKFETFPIWNLPLKHMVNQAYEATTVDIGDYNLVDPFHLAKYKITAINYNRDVESFPIIRKLIEKIVPSDNYMHKYFSPTDMGVNKAGFAIMDDKYVQQIAKEEIIRRYFWTLDEIKNNQTPEVAKTRIIKILKDSNLTPTDLDIVKIALEKKAIVLKIIDQIFIFKTIDALLNDSSLSSKLKGATLHSPFSLTTTQKEQLDTLGIIFTYGNLSDFSF